jgi:hypothetical protein
MAVPWQLESLVVVWAAAPVIVVWMATVVLVAPATVAVPAEILVRLLRLCAVTT